MSIGAVSNSDDEDDSPEKREFDKKMKELNEALKPISDTQESFDKLFDPPLIEPTLEIADTYLYNLNLISNASITSKYFFDVIRHDKKLFSVILTDNKKSSPKMKSITFNITKDRLLVMNFVVNFIINTYINTKYLPCFDDVSKDHILLNAIKKLLQNSELANIYKLTTLDLNSKMVEEKDNKLFLKKSEVANLVNIPKIETIELLLNQFNHIKSELKRITEFANDLNKMINEFTNEFLKLEKRG